MLHDELLELKTKYDVEQRSALDKGFDNFIAHLTVRFKEEVAEGKNEVIAHMPSLNGPLFLNWLRDNHITCERVWPDSTLMEFTWQPILPTLNR